MDQRNNPKYCTRCLQTRRFYELDDRFVCERCRKALWKRPLKR